MSETAVDLLKRRLIEIHHTAEQALRELEQPDVRVARWHCAACGYVKHFTRPASAKTAEGCPKCGEKPFVPVLEEDGRGGDGV